MTAPKEYIPKVDPKDVDAAMGRMEGKVREAERAKDVLHQLKQKIAGTPDDEVNIPDTLRAIRTAAAYSPPNSAIHQLLRGTDPEKTGDQPTSLFGGNDAPEATGGGVEHYTDSASSSISKKCLLLAEFCQI